MTGGIRERARGYLDRFVDEPTWDAYSPDAEQALVDLILSERAAALGAAAQLFDAQARFAVQTGQRGKEMWALNSAYRIRALSPAGWVGVRAEDLAVLKEAAHEALAHYYAPLEELQQYRDRADEIRASLARMP